MNFFSSASIAETHGNSRIIVKHFTPYFNSYDKALQYQTYDVTGLLPYDGEETRVSVLLGNGWYKGRLGFDGNAAVYGDRFALIAELWLTYADGSRQVITTGPDWTYRASHIMS